MSERLGIHELAREIGLTERSLRTYVGLGLPVVETGPRGKMLFDLAKCREWLTAYRRTVVGEGRPRAAGDVEARKKRHDLDSGRGPGKKESGGGGDGESGGKKSPPRPLSPSPRGAEKTPRAAKGEEAAGGGTREENPSDGLPDIADKTPGELLEMVAKEEIGPGHVSLFKQVLEAMELTAEFRLRMKQLVRVEDVEAEQKRRLVWARGILDRMPDSVVAAVSGVVPLDESQRHRVRENVRKEVDTVIDQLGGGKA